MKIKNQKVLCLFNNTSYFKFSRLESKKFDPYLALDLSRKANWMEIKKQYYKLARQYHPDLNKNDERSQQKFLQIKEAFEYFDKVYNHSKHNNMKNSFPNVEDEKNDTKEEKIRPESKSNFSRKNDIKEEELNTESFFRDAYLEKENEQKKIIESFLKDKAPNPRSEKMSDRLNLKQDIIGRGKLFGPDDYFSFSVFTWILVWIVFSQFMDRDNIEYKNQTRNNIYNVLEDGIKTTNTYENKVSPLEQSLANRLNLKQYEKDRINTINKKLYNEKDPIRIDYVSNIDIKEKFNKNL